MFSPQEGSDQQSLDTPLFQETGQEGVESDFEELLRGSGRRAHEYQRRWRPKSTDRAYRSKQKEWTEYWSQQPHCRDGDLVTEDKLCHFLQNHILHREPRSASTRAGPPQGDQDKRTLSVSSIEQYVCAIVDLWNEQKAKGVNPLDNPRGEGILSLLRGRRQQESQRKKRMCLDRAAGTIADGETRPAGESPGLRGRDVTQQLSYVTERCWLADVFRAIGLAPQKITHLGRGQGAQHAELEGVEVEQICRAGQWNQDALTNCYLDALPRPFMRAMAGFQQRGTYYLPRAQVTPPESLTRAIWPWVDEWMAWFRPDAPPDQPIPQVDPVMLARYGPPTRNEVTGPAFLNLLRQFREIILQDSVILREEFPGHVVWTDPVFHRPEYEQFAAQVKQCLQEERPPLEVQLRQVVPALAEQLGLLTRMVSQVAQNQATLMQQFAADQREREAGIQMQIAALQRQLGGASGNAPPSATEQRPRSEPASSWPATVAAELGPNPAPGDPRHAQGGVQQQGRGTPGRPAYTMSREVKPVPDLWREWTEGLHGNPPVQVLESQHGSEWRREHNERMFFHRRKRIIDAIQERCRKGMPIRAAVEELEQIRVRGNMSLHKLSEVLRKGERS